jgi:hypothetical protein
MRIWNRQKRRQSRRKNGGTSCLILFVIAAGFVYGLIAPPDSTPAPAGRNTPTGRAAPTANRRPSNTEMPAARTSTSAPCYGQTHAWVASAMNIRANPSVDAEIVGAAQAGDSFAVRQARKGAAYCWLKIDLGWMAKTINVSAFKPQPAQPITAENVVSGAAQGALAALHALVVAPENRCSPYDSDDYPYPQSVEAHIVSGMGGRIYGPYSGTTFSSKRDTDIEHIVAKSEAHDSGLCGANAQTRKSFARDLLNLTLASPSLNRHQKSGKDFAEWRPKLNVCWFADRIIKVKKKYNLSVDSREKAALQRSLESCSSLAMQ